MLTIAKLYEKDPLQLELAVEFWSPLDLKIVQPASYRVPPRAVSLFKFMRLAGKFWSFIFLNLVQNLSCNNRPNNLITIVYITLFCR